MASRQSHELAHPSREALTFTAVSAALSDPIRLAIVVRLGTLEPGGELPCTTFALPVSKSTQSAHFRTLREAGFLESRRGRSGGTFVVRATGDAVEGPAQDAAALAREMGDTLHDALDFRRVLEPGAAALAATRALSAADRSNLVACLAAARTRDPLTRRVNDSRLHLAIASASGSTSVAASIADVQLRLDRLLAAIPVLRRNLDHSDTQHERVVEAILAGDPAVARVEMEEHCEATAALLRGLLG